MNTDGADASPIVLDGLICFSDRDPTPLREGGVHAANITICDYDADLSSALRDLAQWLAVVERDESGWLLVREASDLVKARVQGKVGLIMGWQNALPLEKDIGLVRIFHRLGLRIVQLTYNEGNAFADGCHEKRNGGLTNAGRALIEAMNQIGMAIDLSHCSETTVQEASRLSKKPVLLTHANAKAVNPNVRNKLDESLSAVADTGGVIGVSIHGFLNWDGDPTHPPSLDGFVRHVRHIADLVGVEHVAIGTDLPCVRSEDDMNRLLAWSMNRYAGSSVGAYIRAFGNELKGRYPKEISSPSQFRVLLEALAAGGFTASDVDRIGGSNMARALREIWNG